MVMHVITRFLSGAGTEENTTICCNGQVEAGYEVVLVHGPEADEDCLAQLHPDVRCIMLRSMVHQISPISDLKCLADLWNLYRNEKPDIVHTHQSKAGILGRLAAAPLNVPAVVHGVHILPFVNVSPLARIFYLYAEKMAAAFTDAYVHVSPGMRVLCQENRVGVRAKHHVVYSGMDLAPFVSGRPPEDWRTILGVPDDVDKPPTLLMVASLDERKGHAWMLESFAGLAREFPGVRLLLAGKGPAEDKLKARVSALGLTENVRFLGFYARPGDLMAMADVCLLTSEREGLPRVVIQYLTAGRPVVVTELPGVDHIVSHGENGFIVRYGDAEALRRRLSEILRNPEVANKLTEGARRTDTSPWGQATLSERTLAVYASLPGRNASPFGVSSAGELHAA